VLLFSGLASKDLLSKSDPLVVCHVFDASQNGMVYVGHSERVM
jgi:hypothetical protein